MKEELKIIDEAIEEMRKAIDKITALEAERDRYHSALYSIWKWDYRGNRHESAHIAQKALQDQKRAER